MDHDSKSHAGRGWHTGSLSRIGADGTWHRESDRLFSHGGTDEVQAPYNGINFASYELLKDIICPPDKQTTPRRLLTGALAGTISQTLTYPLDVLRRKSQMASAKG